MIDYIWYLLIIISTMANNKELDLGNLTLFDFNAVQKGSDDA